MKITKNNGEFKPIKLELEIESQQELDMLVRLFYMDASIPRVVYGNNDSDASTRLGKFMQNVYHTIVDKE